MSTELTWRVVGYHTDINMNGSYSYTADTAKQAEDLCRTHVPDFEIYYTQRVDDYE